MRYLLDTGIAGCYVDRRSGVYERAMIENARGNVVGIAHPVLGELVYRLEFAQHRKRNLQRLNLALATLRLWPVTTAAAWEYGRIGAELRRIGRTIGQNDVMIAAIVRTLGNCTLVTMDSDFSAVPGLAVENWAAAST
ncbi:MAG TPA: type II toxin-antitoxin system VapC family toxin [Planctomycetia bacterium]|nr:type II toxin-antitoxin system VapC family toxin [Planctomycetia bacterium]